MIPASLRPPRAGVSLRVDVRASAGWGGGARGRGGACVAGRARARVRELPRTWVLGVAERGPRPLRRRLCN